MAEAGTPRSQAKAAKRARRKSEGDFKRLLEAPEEMKGEVAVVARFRPLNDEEEKSMKGHLEPFLLSRGKQIEDRRRGVLYTRFNRVLDRGVDQQSTYEATGAPAGWPGGGRRTGQPLVKHVLDGFNAGMIAYGQSGGGKTYSMFGREGDLTGAAPQTAGREASGQASCAGSSLGPWRPCSRRGSRSTKTLMRAPTRCLNHQPLREPGQVSFAISFFEVYKGDLYDLLNFDMDGNCHKLGGREDRHMEQLTEIDVESMDQAVQVLTAGQEKRRYAWMPLNPVSSRSHAVIMFKFRRQYQFETSESALYYVDLMGSEPLCYGVTDREETTAVPPGLCPVSVCQVNMDLLTLGLVIKALADKKGVLVPPYRGAQSLTAAAHGERTDSTLTWVLRDALGGNCLTTMLVTCSPHDMQYHATQNTLEFADQCKGIRRVYSSESRKLSPKELLLEVQRLQIELESSDADVVAAERETHFQQTRADNAEEQIKALLAKFKALEENRANPAELAHMEEELSRERSRAEAAEEDAAEVRGWLEDSERETVEYQRLAASGEREAEKQRARADAAEQKMMLDHQSMTDGLTEELAALELLSIEKEQALADKEYAETELKNLKAELELTPDSAPGLKRSWASREGALRAQKNRLLNRTPGREEAIRPMSYYVGRGFRLRMSSEQGFRGYPVA